MNERFGKEGLTMTLGEKLSRLRKENNFTQEQLADILGVSRQAISKWESGVSYPETEKLIRMAKLFGCTTDYLLLDGEMSLDEAEEKPQETEKMQGNIRFSVSLHEMKSKRTLWGMPLWHIGRNAKGIIAVGLKARGIISVGVFSVGVLSLGMISLGILSFGLLAVGLLSAGCFSVGAFAAGAISFGVISLGAVAVGDFSVGALAVGKYFAMGDNARAMIALGDSNAAGSIFQKTGELSGQEIASVGQMLDETVPSYLEPAKNIIKMFL
ncbi:MAG: helix-turn-helix domain-containing protein [Oscillospiraceae bacterium]